MAMAAFVTPDQLIIKLQLERAVTKAAIAHDPMPQASQPPPP